MPDNFVSNEDTNQNDKEETKQKDKEDTKQKDKDDTKQKDKEDTKQKDDTKLKDKKRDIRSVFGLPAKVVDQVDVLSSSESNALLDEVSNFLGGIKNVGHKPPPREPQQKILKHDPLRAIWSLRVVGLNHP